VLAAAAMAGALIGHTSKESKKHCIEPAKFGTFVCSLAKQAKDLGFINTGRICMTQSLPMQPTQRWVPSWTLSWIVELLQWSRPELGKKQS